MSERLPLGSVDKALRALALLADAGADGMRLSRLAEELSLNKGSLHRTLAALRHRGFVEHDDSSNYCLGTAVLTLADSYMRYEALKGMFHEGLTELSFRSSETCHFGVLIGEQIMYIDKVEPQHAIRTWSKVGWRSPAIRTALGRAILCQKFLDFSSFAARFPDPIPGRGPHNHASMKSIWQQILDSHKRGFAKEEQENEPGVTCIAAALLRGTEVIGAISVTSPSDRMSDRRTSEVIGFLRDCIPPHLPSGFSIQKPVHEAGE